ncbi:MAG: AAA family ATPase [Deltaproteobacteria bacterium]|nr:AAA family ATPase [Deltaproteobacteria bacterium]
MVYRKNNAESRETSKHGTIINVISSKGGIGTTTIAVNLAVSLAGEKNSPSVALIDMNLLFGDIPLFLEIEPKYNWIEITKNISRLDDNFLRNILSVDASGVSVLPSPSYVSDPDEKTPEILAHLLMLMQRVFDFIIIDGGQPLDDISLKILELSDIALLVSILTPPCILNTKKLLKTFRDLGFPLDENIKIVINRYLKKSNISLPDAAVSFEKEIFWNIPNDYQTTVNAINEGQALAQFAPDEAITKNFKKFASKLRAESEKADPAVSSYRRTIKKTPNFDKYIYQKDSLSINRGRRKIDMAQHDAGSKDRRRKMRDGIIIVDHDRRQNDNPDYKGPEKRNRVDRRTGKERRQKE